MNDSRAAGTISGVNFLRARPATETAPETQTRTKEKAEASSRSKRNSERNAVIDVLRGLCIVSMLAGHFGTDTYLKYWTHLPRFFDGASGFVFLSGLVLGLIHARRTAKYGDRATTFLILKRAGLLWFAHCILTTFAFAIHEGTGRIMSLPTVASLGGWGNTLFLISTLRMQPFGLGLDILPLYAIFLLAAPFALSAMKRGGTALPFSVSFALYLSVQVRPDALNFVDARSGNIAFYWAAWQFLFVLGLGAGWHRERLRQILMGRCKPAIIGISGLLFVMGLVFAQLDARSAFTVSRPALVQVLSAFDKPTLGGLHLIYFLAALCPGYFALRALLRTESGHRALRFFAMLGRLSLYCFLVHLGFVLVIRAFATETWTPVQQEWVSLIGVIFVAGMARFHVLRNVIPN